MTRRSATEVVNTASPSPVFHIATVSASPGSTGEAKRRLDVVELGDVAVAQAVQQRPTGEPVAAQAVEDRAVEAAHRGELRVAVQRVAVAAEPVDQRLVGRGLVGDLDVGGALRRDVLRARWGRGRRPSRPRRG